MCRENSDLEKRIGQAKLVRRETRGNGRLFFLSNPVVAMGKDLRKGATG
ncbi:hypothetical protein M5P42_08730 [Streptococcus suis]|nr:hypothetical protein [Streptococcus suis]MCL4943420.1 hypothetical protein [Streptococcus suis]HEM3487845.1 hypothetical protein [Streptococcus suis]HEM3516654.1 hypothetical protein [Streptococcus suis]